MADKEPNVGGLPSIGVDVTKLPLYGREDSSIEDIRQAQKDAITSLEERYKNPNWFKVAAGFAKPQLGGFLASIGSASEAMGENVEQERAQKLPIAQLRIQVAQQNALLNANTKVADRAKAWKDANPGKTMPPQFLGELAAMAPGSPVVAALQKEADFQQAQQTNTMERIRATQTAGLPLSPEMEAFMQQKPEGYPRVPESGGAAGAPPGGAQPTYPPPSSVAPAGTEPPAPDQKITVLPSGARVNDDVLKLHEAGIPIISNVRNEKDQADLRHHKDERGNWRTREGRPVAENSLHLTGNAIDVDPAKPLTPEQQDILKQGGWYRPDPVNDSNHYERPTAGRAKPEEPKFYPQSFPRPILKDMPSTDRKLAQDTHAANIAEAEKPLKERVNNLADMVSGNTYTRTKTILDSSISLMENNREMAAKVFGLLRDSPFLSALQEGFGVSAGPFAAQVNLPIETFTRAGMGEKEKLFADKMFGAIKSIAMNDLQSRGVAMGKVPQQEYMSAMQAYISPNMTAPAALNFLHQTRADFDHNKAWYDQFKKELVSNYNPSNPSPSPYYDIFYNSQKLQDINEKFGKIKQRYESSFNSNLR